MTNGIQYRYTVRKSGWPYSDEKFSELRKWARTQKGFWWNFMDGDHALFSFWARPEDLLSAATSIIGHPPGEVCGIEIDVDRSVLPKHEYV